MNLVSLVRLPPIHAYGSIIEGYREEDKNKIMLRLYQQFQG